MPSKSAHVQAIASEMISDDWLPGEIDAVELFRQWWQRYGVDAAERFGLPAGHVPLYWYVDVTGPQRTTFESAPFSDPHSSQPNGEDFLTFFSWPVSEQTGERLRWPELLVREKRWNESQADKGGFIGEALGWQPSAYQPSFDAVLLARAAGIGL